MTSGSSNPTKPKKTPENQPSESNWSLWNWGEILGFAIVVIVLTVGALVWQKGSRYYSTSKNELVLAQSVVKRDFAFKDNINLHVDSDSIRWESQRNVSDCSVLRERCYLVSHFFNVVEGAQVRTVTAEWLVKFLDDEPALMYVRPSNTEARMLFQDVWLQKVLQHVPVPPNGAVILRPARLKHSDTQEVEPIISGKEMPEGVKYVHDAKRKIVKITIQRPSKDPTNPGCAGDRPSTSLGRVLSCENGRWMRTFLSENKRKTIREYWDGQKWIDSESGCKGSPPPPPRGMRVSCENGGWAVR